MFAFDEKVKEKRLTTSVLKLVSLNWRSVHRGIRCRFEVLKGDKPSWLLTKTQHFRKLNNRNFAGRPLIINLRADQVY